MHHLAQPNRSSSQVYQYTISRINLPEHGPHNVTCTFRAFSACHRRRYQERDLNLLLRHPKHNRSSNTTTKHANITHRTLSHIQPQIRSNPQSSIRTVTQSTVQQNRHCRIHQETTTKHKLLRKIAKKNSYIKTLDDAFKQAIEINRETSFVEAASGRYSDQNCTKIETQINKLDDSFQDCDINAMNTRSTNRSGDGSFNGFSTNYARFIRTVCTRRIRWSCEGLTSVTQQIHWMYFEAFIAETYVHLVATEAMCYSTGRSALTGWRFTIDLALYCAVPYIAACVDVSRTVFRDCSIGRIPVRWGIWCCHTECTIYQKFGMTHLTLHSGQCLFAKCLPAVPGPQHQLSAWKGSITKASGLDYEHTRTSQCKKVTGEILPLHM